MFINVGFRRQTLRPQGFREMNLPVMGPRMWKGLSKCWFPFCHLSGSRCASVVSELGVGVGYAFDKARHSGYTALPTPVKSATWTTSKSSNPTSRWFLQSSQEFSISSYINNSKVHTPQRWSVGLVQSFPKLVPKEDKH